MKLIVLKHIRLRKAGKVFDIQPGAIITIPRPEKAQALIQSGHVRPLLPPDEAGKPIGAKIYSNILQDTIWVAFDSTFTGDTDGIPVYSIEEILMMRGADEHTMRLLHACKKELGGCLIKGGQS